MYRLIRRVSPLWLAPVIALAVSGCGGLLASRSLTGGSVPVGTSKAAIVVDTGTSSSEPAEAQVAMVPVGSISRFGTDDPQTPIEPNPDPTPPPPGTPPPGPIFPPTPGGTQNGSYREYLFDNLPAGRYSLNVSIPGSTAYAPFAWSFELPGDSMARAVTSLWPSNFEADTVGEVQISPRYVTVSPGETVRFFGAATDVLGERIPHSVSYMLIGDTGELAPQGWFTARRLGKSTITAWMNGKSAVADINVVP